MGFTVVFEIILGGLVMDLSWVRILEDYNVVDGGLMPFGLLFMFAAPIIWQWLAKRDGMDAIGDGHDHRWTTGRLNTNTLKRL